MTPIRLTNVEIPLPDSLTLSSPKVKPRRISTAVIRRRSIEGRSFSRTFAEVPAEIITTRCSTRIKSADPRRIVMRRSEMNMLSDSERFSHSLIRTRTNRSSSSPRKGGNERIRGMESGCASPIAFSPVYTNNFDS
jgi:hypothetical protein